MKLGRRFGISSSILLLLIIVAVAWGYTRLNGTPWGKTHAQQKVLAFIQQKYGWSTPIIDSPIVWNWKSNDYEIGVTFQDHMSNVYFFEVKNGAANWYVTLPADHSTDVNFDTTSPPPINPSK